MAPGSGAECPGFPKVIGSPERALEATQTALAPTERPPAKKRHRLLKKGIPNFDETDGTE